ncbi:di/tricarboxylate transporter [Sinorhizobium fredii]
MTLATGDVLVLQGSRPSLTALLQDFALFPLAQREVLLGTRRRAFVPLTILALAMATTAAGLASVPVAFFAAALGMIVSRAIPLTDVYKSIEGPILVMLAALIPVSDSLRTSGASELVARWLGDAASGLPPWGALALLWQINSRLTMIGHPWHFNRGAMDGGAGCCTDGLAEAVR